MLKKKVIRGSLVGLSVFIVCMVLFYLNAFQAIEWKTWDLRLWLFSNPSQASEDIVLILINQESLDAYAQEQGLSWPWPRQMYVPILKYCTRGGAKAIFFDFIFSESSGWGVEDDQALAEAMAKARNVFLPVHLSHRERESNRHLFRYLQSHAVARKDIPPNAVFSMKSVTLPVEDLLAVCQGIGNVQIPPDSDSIYRRFPLFFSLEEEVYPVLPLAIARFIDRDLNPNSIPLDKSGQMVIRYHGPTGTYPTYSAAAVINSFAVETAGESPQIEPNAFQDKIVLVGGSAPGLLDLRPTPFSPVYPGIEMHATAIDNLLQRDFVRFPHEAFFIFFLGALSLIAGIGTSLIQKIWQTAAFIMLCVAVPIGFVWIAFTAGFWWELIAPEFAVLSAFTLATLLNYRQEGRRRRFIKRVFTHYLSPHVIEKVIQDPSLLRLGGERREVTSFFTDVAGFTAISERLSPEELVALLNDYLSHMTDIILAYGGTLDKYEGDAIIAFWNAPLDHPDHALRACRAALECQKRLAELQPRFRAQFGSDIAMRIGINSGPAVVGNMGSHQRFDYTAMGDTINLASRLEGACKQFGVDMLIGEDTFKEVKGVMVAREVDIIRVIGKEKPIRVYEIIGEKTTVSAEQQNSVEIFHQAIKAYRNMEWDTALDLCRRVKGDAVAQLYIERIQQHKKSPPPEGWDGVYELTKK